MKRKNEARKNGREGTLTVMMLNFVPKALSNRLTLNNLLLLTGNASVLPGAMS